MPDNMRAFVMKQVGEAAVEEKPIPEPGPNEAVVRTTAALVCTSDVHTVKGAIPMEPNLTLGHEAVGVVHHSARLWRASRGGTVSWSGRSPPASTVITASAASRPNAGHARRLQVHRPARRQHGGSSWSMTPRPISRRSPTSCPTIRPCTRPTCSRRASWRRERRAAAGRDGRHLRAGPRRSFSHDWLPAARGRADLRGGVDARATRALPAVRSRRHHRLHQGRSSRPDHGADRG